MYERIEITQAELQAALLVWHQTATDGAWKTPEGATPEQIAEANADYLWGVLKQK